MSKVILHFVRTSFGEGLFKKAIECMAVLRQTCAEVTLSIVTIFFFLC